jgi:hypothetical protein
LATTVLRLRPTLAEHACRHRGFGCFGDKLLGSSLPHLVEHLAIDMLVEQARGGAREGGGGQAEASSRSIAGNTRWLDRPNGVMSVMVSSTAESAEASCTAIKSAVELVNSLTIG